MRYACFLGCVMRYARCVNFKVCEIFVMRFCNFDMPDVQCKFTSIAA